MLPEFFRSRLASFKYAFNGWWYVIRTQRNAWIHTLASIAVIGISIWLQLEHLEWALIIVAIAFVWTAEFFNTALEVIVDLATKETHPLAKAAKDVGAAAVLIASITAVVIGIIVLGPHLLSKIYP
ncbi:MAG TPA: diacylglycerol kinase [Chloroflexi bacterium]|nr:diacylglycerol kinase [Chloroflexota bacterium]